MPALVAWLRGAGGGRGGGGAGGHSTPALPTLQTASRCSVSSHRGRHPPARPRLRTRASPLGVLWLVQGATAGQSAAQPDLTQNLSCPLPPGPWPQPLAVPGRPSPTLNPLLCPPGQGPAASSWDRGQPEGRWGRQRAVFSPTPAPRGLRKHTQGLKPKVSGKPFSTWALRALPAWERPLQRAGHGASWRRHL